MPRNRSSQWDGGHSRAVDRKSRQEQSEKAIRSQAERAKSFFATDHEAPQRQYLSRRGVSFATPIYYATRADPSAWMDPAAGRPLTEYLLMPRSMMEKIE